MKNVIGKVSAENNVVKNNKTDAYPLSLSKLSANIGAIAAVGIADSKIITFITFTGHFNKFNIIPIQIGTIKSFVIEP